MNYSIDASEVNFFDCAMRIAKGITVYFHTNRRKFTKRQIKTYFNPGSLKIKKLKYGIKVKLKK